MKKMNKTVWLPLALFVYISATAAYLLPRNTEVSVTEKFLTVGFAYLIVLALWLVLRQKDKMRRRREQL